MIGKNTIVLDYNDFIRGLSTSDNLPDGGFSPSTDNVNLTYAPGVIYAPTTQTDKSTNLTGNIIAAAFDPDYLGEDAVFIDEDSSFYTWNGTTLTKQATASSDKLQESVSDFVAWYDSSGGVNFYATTKAGANGDIIKWNGGATLTETWWSGAGTLNQAALSAFTAWRPLCVYETNLYVGDANKLHRIDPALTVSNSILSLSATEVISALGVDKGSGYLLIATTAGVDSSLTRNGTSKLYLYDGFSNKPARVIPANGTITAIKNLDDATYIFYGNNIGVFTGNGIRFLRRLNFALGDNTKAIYPHRATVIENTLYFAENNVVIAYGEVRGNTPKVFYPALKNLSSSNVYKCIHNIGSKKLGVSCATNKFYTFDTTSVASTNTADVYFNRINFPRPIYVREVYVEYNESIADAFAPGTFYIMGDNGSTNSISLTNNTGSTFYSKHYTKLSFNGVKFNSIQPRLALSVSSKGIKRIVISYDVAE
jgi:hypothetical protein